MAKTLTRNSLEAAPSRTGAALRARPSGRASWQQELKVETRGRLLNAAAKIFEERGYAATSVEDIIKLAGVGRTSFYRHFDSRWMIASALCEEVMPAAWTLWKELAAHRDPTHSEIVAWLKRRLRLYIDHRAMFAVMREAVAIEPAGMQAVTRTHDEVIRVLSSGIDAFRTALRKTAVGRQARIKASLLLMQLDEFNYFLAIRGWDVDYDTAVDVMATQFRRFIDDVAGAAAKV